MICRLAYLIRYLLEGILMSQLLFWNLSIHQITSQSNIIAFASVISQEYKIIQTCAMHYCWCGKCEEPTSPTSVPTQTYCPMFKRHVSRVFNYASLQSMPHIYLTYQVHWEVANIYTQYKILSIQTCSFAISCNFDE